MQLNYRRLDVFTDRALTGNPLAVFLDVPEMATEKMQAIAREMNLSESVFVSARSPSNEWPVRIFTPGVELPFAGHPTIGTAVALLLNGCCARGARCELALLETVGRVPVSVERLSERHATATFSVPRLPEFGTANVPNEILAELLSVEKDDVLVGLWKPRAISCGVPFYFVGLRSLEAIRKVRVRRDLWEQHLSTHWAPHLYVITPEVISEGATVHARMFPPAMGLEEDPATGGAVAALSGFLVDALKAGKSVSSWRVEQGFEMGRPSIIDLQVHAENDLVTAIKLTGSAVAVGEGSLTL